MGVFLLFAVGLFMIGDRQMAFVRVHHFYAEFRKITVLLTRRDRASLGRQSGSITEILPRTGRAESSASSSR